MPDDEALEAILEVVKALEALKVDYLVVGSLASSLHGIPRSTHDADLVADLSPDQVDLLAAELQDRFFFDPQRIREAVKRRSSFSVVYLKNMFKVDLFVLNKDPLSLEEMRRRQQVAVDAAGHTVAVASAEDTALQKLVWYRKGGGGSERQWRDLLGVLTVCRDQLDLEYLRRWARELRLDELLEKALQEVGIAGP